VHLDASVEVSDGGNHARSTELSAPTEAASPTNRSCRNDKNGYGGLESFGCAVALLSLGTVLVRDELDVERSHLCLENVGFDRGV
jgi:hypothetical protein